MQHFMPLVLSIDVVMGEEKKAATKQLVDALSNKWNWAYLETCGYVLDRLSLNLLWSLSLIVHGPRRVRTHPIRKMTEDGLEAYILVVRGAWGD